MQDTGESSTPHDMTIRYGHSTAACVAIKDRIGMGLTKAEDIRNRWQEYTEELYKKDLHDPHNYNGVITHLEPDILDCEVK